MSDKITSAGRRTFLKGTGTIVASSVIGGVASASSDNGTGHGRPSRRVVGYYPSWASEYMPADIPFKKITHLNYAFVEPESNGEVKLPVAHENNPEILEDLAEVADEHEGTTFMFSVSSGWFTGMFSDAASTAERRERFARTAIDLMQTYNFDGIDIDWEYPDGTIRDEDPENLTLLLAEIRRQLDELDADDGDEDDRTYELSMAAAPVPSRIDVLEIEKISEYLDHVNVMNYDFHGGWSQYSNFNAPLHLASDDPNGNELLTAHNAMQHWADQPIDNEKLTFGLPFYGRTFEEAPSENDGLFQPFEGSEAETYWNIESNIRSQSHYEYHWHDEAKAPWVYSPEDERMIAYDDERSIATKAQYTVDNDFGGVMCWELTQDSSNTLIDAIYNVFTDPKNRGKGKGPDENPGKGKGHDKDRGTHGNTGRGTGKDT